MKGRTTFLLLLVLVVLGGYVWFVEREKPTPAQVEAEAKTLLSIAPARVDKVTIDGDMGRVELWKDSDQVWRMVKPVEDRADANTVNALLHLLNPLKSTRSVPGDRGSIVTYRLDRPEVVATFRIPRTSGFQSYELRVGRLNPAFNGHYAIVDEDTTRLGLLDRGFVEGYLLRDPMDYRFRRISDFKLEQAQRVIVQAAGNPRVLIERRFDRQWEIREPVTAYADQAVVNQLVRRLSSQRIATFIDEDPTSVSAYGLEEPRLAIQVVLEDQRSTRLLVGAENPGSGGVEGVEIFAKRASLPKVFTIAGSAYPELAKTLFDLRSRDLFDITPTEVDSIVATAGNQTFQAIRRGESNWVTADGRSLQSLVMNQLIQNLSATHGREFLDRPRAERDVGLDKPELDVSVYQVNGKVSSAAFVSDADNVRWWGRALPQGAVARIEPVDLAAIRQYLQSPPLGE